MKKIVRTYVARKGKHVMAVKGIPAFDAVELVEVENLNFSAGRPELVAHGAFLNTLNGRTYGKTTVRTWSKQTLELLEALRHSIEVDMAGVLFLQTSHVNAQDALTMTNASD